MATPPVTKERGPFSISPAASSRSESFPYGHRAKELLASLKKAEWLTEFDEEGIRAVQDECNRLMDMLKELTLSGVDPQQDPSVAVTMQTFHQSICRNKRCILAYLNYRLEKIEALWWKSASPILAPEYASKLSKGEQEYFSRYQELVSKTMSAIDMDLTSHLQPPHDLFIEVRALQNAGEVLLQSGARVFLQQNSTHYLRRSDVEHLVRQNVLEQVS